MRLLRLLADTGRDLRAHRLRTLLNAISLFVGVLAVIAVTAIGSIVQDVFVANAEQHDGRRVTVGTSLNRADIAEFTVAGLSDVLDRRVRSAGGSWAVTADIQGRAAGRQQPITLVAGDLSAIKRLPILAGAWFDGSRAAFPGGIVVNQAARDSFGGLGTQLPLQISTVFQPYPQRIVGVIADGVDAPKMYVSLPYVDSVQPGILAGDTVLDLVIHAGHTGEQPLRQAMADVLTDLRIDSSGVDVRRLDTVDSLLDGVRQTRALFAIVAAVLLGIAALGLLNIGLATVRERRRELTIRRALGSTRLRMFSLVLLSTLAAGLLAALSAAGIAVSVTTLAVPHLLDPAKAVTPPEFPVGAAVAGLAAALGASLLGGLAPAIAAARVDMAFVLRE